MWSVILPVLRWFFSKTAMLLILWVLVIGAVAVYIASKNYLEDLPEKLADKEKLVSEYRQQAQAIDEKLEALNADLRKKAASLEETTTALKDSLKSQEGKIKQWQESLKKLTAVKRRALRFWNYVRGVDPDFEIKTLENRISIARKQTSHLTEQLTQRQQESDALESDVQQERARLKTQQEQANQALYRAIDDRDATANQFEQWDGRVDRGKEFVKAAFAKVGKPLIIVSVSIIALPLIVKMLLFYLWAPIVSLGKSVIINTNAAAPVKVSTTEVAQEVVLEPGEIATIQHKFFQASDEDLHKRTKFVFSWHYPFSCLACGLFLLTRVHNRTKDSQRRLTLSSQQEAEIEMAVIDIPKDGSLICRPSFVAALVQDGNSKARHIRSHWRFFSLHSWITLQFRYFEFRGPVRLVLWAYRGVRAEHLTAANIREGNERRTNQLATIGFTPSLRYRSRRSETFISYLRDDNPLFDDLFSGQGVFLCQQISRADHARQAGKFWARLWNGITKIIGI